MNCIVCGKKLTMVSGAGVCSHCNPDKMKKIIDDKYGMNKTISNEEPTMGRRMS